jgi:hypothetical protein
VLSGEPIEIWRCEAESEQPFVIQVAESGEEEDIGGQ